MRSHTSDDTDSFFERFLVGLARVMDILRQLSLWIIALGAIFGALIVGMGLGYMNGIMQTQQLPSTATLEKQLTAGVQTSSLYFAGGQKISNIKTDLERHDVTYQQVSPYLIKAIIATEDEDFYHHSGVTPKSLIRAALTSITGIGSQTGGSTITQQLVKMQLLTSEMTWRRKVIELFLALRVNRHFSKQQQLTDYLNAATFGRNNSGQNIAGVYAAAEGIFGKTPRNLTLAQAAFIAGLPQSPSVFTPYTSTGARQSTYQLGLDKKNLVLFRMYRQGAISAKDYRQALKEDLTQEFLPSASATTTQSTKYGYVYNLVMNEAHQRLALILAKKDGYSSTNLQTDSTLFNRYWQQADTALKTGGYRITSTINQTLYDRFQTVIANYGTSLGTTYTKNGVSQPVQNGSVLLDNQTGAVLAFIGGRNFSLSQVNHAFNTTRSPGSSIKPLLVYGPAIEQKLITTQSMLPDFKIKFGSYAPTDYGSQIQNRFLSVREALEMSYNIPAVNLYNVLLAKSSVSPKSYLSKMGISLTNAESSQLAIALGGTTKGFSVVQNAAAYTTFANNGNYRAPFLVQKITDRNGHVVYEHQGTSTKVYSSGTAYIVRNLLHSVVQEGTATSLKQLLNFSSSSVYGKTGTSNDYHDIWFVGSTAGITLASWIGYDNYAYQLTSDASARNLRLWAALANTTYASDPNLLKVNQQDTAPSTVNKTKVLTTTGTKSGSVKIDGQEHKLSGTTTTALGLSTSAPSLTEKFAVTGTDQDYSLFWNYTFGKSNNYGKVTTEKDDDTH